MRPSCSTLHVPCTVPCSTKSMCAASHVLLYPPCHCSVPLTTRRSKAILCTPVAALYPGPQQHIQVPSLSAAAQALTSQGQPGAPAHCSISKCPPPAALAHVLPFPGHPCPTSRPFQYLQVTSSGSSGASTPIQGAALRSRPLPHLHGLSSSSSSRLSTGTCMPGAAWRPQPWQHIQVPFLGCRRAHRFSHVAASRPWHTTTPQDALRWLPHRRSCDPMGLPEPSPTAAPPSNLP